MNKSNDKNNHIQIICTPVHKNNNTLPSRSVTLCKVGYFQMVRRLSGKPCPDMSSLCSLDHRIAQTFYTNYTLHTVTHDPLLFGSDNIVFESYPHLGLGINAVQTSTGVTIPELNASISSSSTTSQ